MTAKMLLGLDMGVFTPRRARHHGARSPMAGSKCPCTARVDALQRLAAPLNIMDSWYVRAWVVKGE